MLDFQLLSKESTTIRLLEYALKIFLKEEQKESGEKEELTREEKGIVSSLYREIKKMRQLNRERLGRTLKMNKLEREKEEVILDGLNKLEKIKKTLLYSDLKDMNYRLITRMDYKVQVVIMSEENKKVRPQVVLTLLTQDHGKYVYSLDQSQFLTFRLQIAQLYHSHVQASHT